MRTDPGRKRGYNQDSVGKQEPADADLLRKRGALYIVADGVGGGKAGEVASQIAVRMTIKGYYGAPPTMDNARALRHAIIRANSEAYRQSQENPDWRGMATTIVAVVAELDRTLIMANVGDSSGYLVRDGQATVISEEHSWVAEQVAAGILTPQQAKTHKRRHQITRSLGRRPSVEVAMSTHALLPGDIVVLCSDGITDVIEDDEIARAVTSGEPQPVVDELTDLANARGGPDNISVLIIKFPQAAGAVAARPANRRLRLAEIGQGLRPISAKKPFPVAALIGGVVVIAAVVVGAIALSGKPATTPTPQLVAEASVESPVAVVGESHRTIEATQTQEVSTPAPTVAAASPTAAGNAAVPAVAPSASLMPTESAEADRKPTATLVPSPVATNTPLPTPTPARYSIAPSLTEPGNEQWMQSDTAKLKWTFPYGLKANEQYEVRIWKQGQPGVIIKRLRTTQSSYDYKMPDYGKYEWTVVVLRQPSEGSWVEVSDPAAVRAFYWAKAEEPPDDGKPEPTKPKPKPTKPK